MDPKTLKFLSYVGIISVMGLSAAYFYKTWQNGEPRWYFLILAFGIALILVYHIISIKKNS